MRGQSTTESTLQLTADVDGVIDDSVCSFLPRRDTNDVIICGFLGSLLLPSCHRLPSFKYQFVVVFCQTSIIFWIKAQSFFRPSFFISTLLPYPVSTINLVLFFFFAKLRLFHMRFRDNTHVNERRSVVIQITSSSPLIRATSTISWKSRLYSRALGCTFFGEWKNLCSSKFVQLELLNKAKARSSKKPCCSRFSLHKVVHLKFFLDLIQKRAPVSVRPVQLEVVYLQALLY